MSDWRDHIDVLLPIAYIEGEWRSQHTPYKALDRDDFEITVEPTALEIAELSAVLSRDEHLHMIGRKLAFQFDVLKTRVREQDKTLCALSEIREKLEQRLEMECRNFDNAAKFFASAEKWVNKNKVRSAANLLQVDRFTEQLIDLAELVCEWVGYYKDDDGEE